MSIHFASARKNTNSPIVRALVRGPIGAPANDNRDSSEQANGGHTMELKAALRHFARHGLGAAAQARTQAEAAFFAGDREAYRWWLGICRKLDRRVASQLARRVGCD